MKKKGSTDNFDLDQNGAENVDKIGWPAGVIIGQQMCKIWTWGIHHFDI